MVVLSFSNRAAVLMVLIKNSLFFHLKSRFQPPSVGHHQDKNCDCTYKFNSSVWQRPVFQLFKVHLNALECIRMHARHLSALECRQAEKSCHCECTHSFLTKKKISRNLLHAHFLSKHYSFTISSFMESKLDCNKLDTNNFYLNTPK